MMTCAFSGQTTAILFLGTNPRRYKPCLTEQAVLPGRIV